MTVSLTGPATNPGAAAAPQLDHVRPAHPRPGWTLASSAPELHAELARKAPWVADRARELEAGIPAAVHLDPFDEGGFFRPRRHLRAIYQRAPGGEGVLAFKGTEVQLEPLEFVFYAMRSFRMDYLPPRGHSLWSIIDHFPLVEQKVPLALPLSEAEEEVEAAVAFQRAHLQRFGALARAPVPLLVLHWPDEVVRRFVEALAPQLSRRARRVVDWVAASGFAALVYHYPGVPIRVQHLDSVIGAGKEAPRDYASRIAKIRQHTDPQAAIDGWIELVARMLVLGFVPAPVDTHGTGNCLEAQNMVLDGGIVDLGSLRPMSEITDDRAFHEGMLASVADLAISIRELLAGGLPDAEAEYRNPSLATCLLTGRVWEALRERLLGHERAGHVLDPRLRVLFASGPVGAAAAPVLEALFPEGFPDSGHV